MNELALIEALRPFANCVEQIDPSEPDGEWAKFRLLIGDYRRAAKALENVREWRSIDEAPKDDKPIFAVVIFHENYGYTPREVGTLKIKWYQNKWTANQPTGRYFTGFTPLLYIPIPDIPEGLL